MIFERQNRDKAQKPAPEQSAAIKPASDAGGGCEKMTQPSDVYEMERKIEHLTKDNERLIEVVTKQRELLESDAVVIKLLKERKKEGETQTFRRLKPFSAISPQEEITELKKEAAGNQRLLKHHERIIYKQSDAIKNHKKTIEQLRGEVDRLEEIDVGNFKFLQRNLLDGHRWTCKELHDKFTSPIHLLSERVDALEEQFTNINFGDVI